MSRVPHDPVRHDGDESSEERNVDVVDAAPRMGGSGGGERPRQHDLAPVRPRPPLPPAPSRPQQTQTQTQTKTQQEENRYGHNIQQTAMAPLQVAPPLPPVARPPSPLLGARNRIRAPRTRTPPRRSRRQPVAVPERTTEGGEAMAMTETDDSTPLLTGPGVVPLSAYHATMGRTAAERDGSNVVASRPRTNTNASYRSDDEASCTSVSSRTSFTLNYGLFKNLKGSLLPSNTELIAPPMSRRLTMLPGGSGGGGGYCSDDDESLYSSASSSSYSSTTNGTSMGISSPHRDLTHDVGDRRSQHSHESRREHHRRHHHHHHRHHSSQHSRPYQHHVRVKRSLRRRIFLLLTEPQSSIFSAVFFILLIFLIAASNVVMMMQTMNYWQFTPDGCDFCGNGDPMYGDDNVNAVPIEDDSMPCECPPQPVPEIVHVEDALIYFFTVEWSVRVLCFVPPAWEQAKAGTWRSFWQWLSYLSDSTVVMDALAIFPYYLERFEKTNGLLSLRLLRLFRVFQLLRLGQYNVTFTTLSNVLMKSMLALNVLLIVLIFGAAFFGSIIYWLEKGEWKYTDYTDPPSFMFMRISADGVTDEPSPFVSIPSSFWWFVVTATTVGYGDVYPTSVGGKLVAGAAMLIGVLVIAFPVSVFSDLWSKELKKRGALVTVESSESLTDLVGEVQEKPSIGVDVGPKTNDGAALSKELLHLAAEKTTENGDAKLPIASDVVDMCGSEDASSHAVAGGMMLTQAEVQSIYCHLERIEESQREIRNILHRNRLLGDGIAPSSP